jgi:hypothetical protein
VNALHSCRDISEDEMRVMINEVTLLGSSSSVLVTCYLDECQFSAGMLRGYGGGNLVELKEQLVLRNNSGFFLDPKKFPFFCVFPAFFPPFF